MSTASMARIKRDPKTLEIANAILEQYDCQTVEDMQNAFKDIFGPIFESRISACNVMDLLEGRIDFCIENEIQTNRVDYVVLVAEDESQTILEAG